MACDDANDWLAGGSTLTDYVDRLSAAGINVYIPQMNTGSQAHWDNDAGWPWSGNTQFQNLLDACEAAGIEVHAWIRINSRSSPADILPQYAPGPSTPTGHFDINLAAFQDAIVALCQDIIDKFPKVKGIAFDFIRAGGRPNPSAANIAAYSAFTGGRSLADDYSGQYDQPQYRFMRLFNRLGTTSIVRRVGSYGRSIDPNFRLSAFTVPGLDTDFFQYSYREGRDATFWVNEGLIDYAWMMRYGDVPNAISSLKAVDRESSARDRHRFVFMTNTYESGTIVPVGPTRMLYRWDLAKATNPHGNAAVYHVEDMTLEMAQALGAGPNAIATKPAWEING